MTAIIDKIVSYIHKYLWITSFSVTDVIEIILIALLFYEIMIWFKKTRAWALFKGILMILIVVILAAIFDLSTILWIASKTLSVGIIGVIIIFQPELRKALENLGKGSLLRSLFGNNKEKLRISESSIEEVLEAVEVMSKAHTGALICFEKDITLSEYENSGIKLDSLISMQLIVNIFEDKTPLHDGAIIIRNDRIMAATCYLPMSASASLSKQYGTRHRAALGLSEVTDALTVVVSEETGDVSVTLGGQMYERVSHAMLKNELLKFQLGDGEQPLVKKLKKGRKNNETAEASEEVGNK